MSAAVALLNYAHGMGVHVRVINDSVRLSGHHEAVKQVAGSIGQYREVLLRWLQQEPANETPPAVLDQQAAGRYYAHHFGCLTCIGAGQLRGLRCLTGLELWGAYLQSITLNQSGVHDGQA